jgi:hypothetical protein
LKIQIHESFAPLWRGIGLTIVLLGTLLAAVQTREEDSKAKEQAYAAESGTKPGNLISTNAPDEKLAGQLSEEIQELRDTVQQETTVQEVLANPWFGSLGTLGSAITAASFYVEWISKRQKRDSENPPPETQG